MEVIIFLLITVAVVFVPYFIGKLANKTSFGERSGACTVFEVWYFGMMLICIISSLILIICWISVAIIYDVNILK